MNDAPPRLPANRTIGRMAPCAEDGELCVRDVADGEVGALV